MKKEKPKVYPVDRETWRMMHYDPMYYVPHSAYDEYDFLKVLSMTIKKRKEDEQSESKGSI